MSSDLSIPIPKSTAHQALTCIDALIEEYRRQRPAGGSRTVGDLLEFREAIAQSMRASRDRTARMGAFTLSRISERLTACAQAEVGPAELQAAMWRTAGRLHRWVAEGTAPPPATRPSSSRAPGLR
ncbi:hypothetical protein Y900_016235 [Mycolicibacterium aromaticivorans JS19b1 = JCM 16368]|uniref:Uncharacterized protein n=1 Tax=Mycolicibacterium aromaticivorans JS19b1 = JCM 16368 TaxID=1440774 RepID=A0A064CIP9_9MYCO|nr:hypothetical protein [Mycolicibacterium aromaticivorans]KDF00450.1 hypothetical protein Y900_016235 [Mycolicibacterium aromaticivorans JS19b1 = JCM 16368]